MLADAQRFRHASDLQHRAGARAIRGVARIGVEDARDAGRRRGQAEEEADGGGLAGAVRPEECGELARVNVERNVVERHDGAVALRHVCQSRGNDVVDASHANKMRHRTRRRECRKSFAET